MCSFSFTFLFYIKVSPHLIFTQLALDLRWAISRDVRVHSRWLIMVHENVANKLLFREKKMFALMSENILSNLKRLNLELV